MFKSIDLNKEYSTREEMIKDIVKHKSDIIAFKKSVIYKSVDKGQVSSGLFKGNVSKGLSVKDDYIQPIINTTNFLDSHLDNHIKGIWSKSLKEQKGRIRYSLDHSTKVTDVIAYPKDVSMSIIDTTFKELGYDYDSETQALAFEIPKSAIYNDVALKVIDKELPVQNSVSMQYVKIELAVNIDDEEYSEEYKLWLKHYPNLANKDFADEIGLMWIVSEAKIVNESSMVTQGSNSATPILYSKGEPTLLEMIDKMDTHKTKAADSTFDIINAISETKINLKNS